MAEGEKEINDFRAQLASFRGEGCSCQTGPGGLIGWGRRGLEFPYCREA